MFPFKHTLTCKHGLFFYRKRTIIIVKTITHNYLFDYDKYLFKDRKSSCKELFDMWWRKKGSYCWKTLIERQEKDNRAKWHIHQFNQDLVDWCSVEKGMDNNNDVLQHLTVHKTTSGVSFVIHTRKEFGCL